MICSDWRRTATSHAADSKPAQIFKNRAFEFGAAARRIDVFDAQDEAPAARPRRLVSAERRIGMAEVEKSGWTWGEAGDNHGHENLHRKPPCMSMLDGPRLMPQSGPATHLVVLCHGYGSDGNDLIGLAPHWQKALPHTAFVSPNAPDRCSTAGAGYQWFPISRLDPQETLRGTEGAAPKLNAFLDAELSRLELIGDRLALVGFSQGTMMSLYVGLRRKPAPAAIVGFSGILTGAETLPHLDAPPPVLLVHGDADQVIPPSALFMSATTLGAAGGTGAMAFEQGASATASIPLVWASPRGFLVDAFSGRVPRTGPVTTPFAR